MTEKDGAMAASLNMVLAEGLDACVLTDGTVIYRGDPRWEQLEAEYSADFGDDFDDEDE